MKKTILILALISFTFSFAQWTESGSNVYTTNSGNNVGIGTNAPASKLHVEGSNPGGDVALTIKNTHGNIVGTSSVINFVTTSTPTIYGGIRVENVGVGSGEMTFLTRGSGAGALERMRLKSNGYIGIGTANPSEKLTVNGKILCEEVEVILDVAPDYVFQKYYTGFSSLKGDYNMPTLEEVEAFTKANHHLQEVPSAAEIKDEGLQLKEMTAILLQKVEELTLYTIEQEKRIKMLEAALEKE